MEHLLSIVTNGLGVVEVRSSDGQEDSQPLYSTVMTGEHLTPQQLDEIGTAVREFMSL